MLTLLRLMNFRLPNVEKEDTAVLECKTKNNKPNMLNDNIEMEWVSVSTLAKRTGVTVQTIYARIKNGVYETQKFERGKMVGWLIKVPKE